MEWDLQKAVALLFVILMILSSVAYGASFFF